MAAREFRGVIYNELGDYPIIWQVDECDGGDWQDPFYPSQPTGAGNIKPHEHGEWRSESSGDIPLIGNIATGTSGWARWAVRVDDVNDRLGNHFEFIQVNWSVPFLGYPNITAAIFRNNPAESDPFVHPDQRPPLLEILPAYITGSSGDLTVLEVVSSRIGPYFIALPLSFFIDGAIFGSNYHPLVNFVVRRRGSSESRGSLKSEEPLISNVSIDVNDLTTSVIEAGKFEFTGKNSGRCKLGLWSYEKVLHKQVIMASVIIRHLRIQWLVCGVLLTDSAGTLSIGVHCTWPFPLPNGRGENRVVNVKYEIEAEENKSTLRVFNNPDDGNYSISIRVSALSNEKEYYQTHLSRDFQGETCKFETEQIKKMLECLKDEVLNKRHQIKSPRPPHELSPSLIDREKLFFPAEILKLVPIERHEVVHYIKQIAVASYPDDPETFVEAINQLEQEIGIYGIARLIKSSDAI